MIRNLNAEARTAIEEGLARHSDENPAYMMGLAPMPTGDAGLVVVVLLPSIVLGEWMQAVIPVPTPSFVGQLTQAVDTAVVTLLDKRTQMMSNGGGGLAL